MRSASFSNMTVYQKTQKKNIDHFFQKDVKSDIYLQDDGLNYLMIGENDCEITISNEAGELKTQTIKEENDPT